MVIHVPEKIALSNADFATLLYIAAWWDWVPASNYLRPTWGSSTGAKHEWPLYEI